MVEEELEGRKNLFVESDGVTSLASGEGLLDRSIVDSNFDVTVDEKALFEGIETTLESFSLERRHHSRSIFGGVGLFPFTTRDGNVAVRADEEGAPPMCRSISEEDIISFLLDGVGRGKVFGEVCLFDPFVELQDNRRRK